MSATAPGRFEKDETVFSEKATRRKLKRIIGKGRDDQLNEALLDIPTVEELIHVVSQQNYCSSLSQHAQRHYSNALKEQATFKDRLRGRALFAQNPTTIQKLKDLHLRVDRLGRIVIALTNAGMGVYPETALKEQKE